MDALLLLVVSRLVRWRLHGLHFRCPVRADIWKCFGNLLFSFLVSSHLAHSSAATAIPVRGHEEDQRNAQGQVSETRRRTWYVMTVG